MLQRLTPSAISFVTFFSWQELERIRKLEQNPTLRWEHARQDPAAEEARLKKYKEERRKRYRQHRAKVVEAARAQQGPNISLRPPP